MIEYVEYDVYEILNSIVSKSVAIICYKIYNGKDDVLPLSKFVDLIETLGEGFNSEYLEVRLRKVDPNESDSLDRFALDYAEEAERLVGWYCKVRLMDLRRESF